MTPDWPLSAQIERPLDFAAVTDHSENIGAVSLCMTPGSDVYDSKEFRYVRKPLPLNDMAAFSAELAKVFPMMYGSEEICDSDCQRRINAAQAPWKEIQTAAHQWNNACQFTTFVGYLNDVLEPTYGELVIRLSMLGVLQACSVGAVLFALALRTIEKNMEAGRRAAA